MDATTCAVCALAEARRGVLTGGCRSDGAAAGPDRRAGRHGGARGDDASVAGQLGAGAIVDVVARTAGSQESAGTPPGEGRNKAWA